VAASPASRRDTTGTRHGIPALHVSPGEMAQPVQSPSPPPRDAAGDCASIRHPKQAWLARATAWQSSISSAGGARAGDSRPFGFTHGLAQPSPLPSIASGVVQQSDVSSSPLTPACNPPA